MRARADAGLADLGPTFRAPASTLARLDDRYWRRESDRRRPAHGARRAGLVQGHVHRRSGRGRDRTRPGAGRAAGRSVPDRRRGRGHARCAAEPLGAQLRSAPATDPLGRELEARFAIAGQEAIIETAAASGLGLVAPADRDPWAREHGRYRRADPRRRRRRRRGSSTSASAAAPRPTAAPGRSRAIERGGGLGASRLVVLCDVRTPFEDAARVFGPQKGASADDVRRLTRAAARSRPSAGPRPARCPDDRRGRRPFRRPVVGVRGRTRSRRFVRARCDRASTPGCAAPAR